VAVLVQGKGQGQAAAGGALRGPATAAWLVDGRDWPALGPSQGRESDLRAELEQARSLGEGGGAGGRGEARRLAQELADAQRQLVTLELELQAAAEKLEVYRCVGGCCCSGWLAPCLLPAPHASSHSKVRARVAAAPPRGSASPLPVRTGGAAGCRRTDAVRGLGGLPPAGARPSDPDATKPEAELQRELQQLREVFAAQQQGVAQVRVQQAAWAQSPASL
jgi:hypothetical protein